MAAFFCIFVLMSTQTFHTILRKTAIWLGVCLFFIASCQTKNSLESLFNISLSKSIAATKTTASSNCAVYVASAHQQENQQKQTTAFEAAAVKMLFSSLDLHAAVVAKTHYPLKIPLYLLFKNIKIAFLVRA